MSAGFFSLAREVSKYRETGCRPQMIIRDWRLVDGYQNRTRRHIVDIIYVVGREGFEPSKVSRQIYSLLPLATWVPTRQIP